MIDQLVDGFLYVLHRIHGCVHYGVNVERARFFGGGDEPIHVDPKQTPDYGINGIRQMLPRTCPWLMKGVSKGTASQISNGISGPFNRVGPCSSGGTTQTGFSSESSNISLALSSFSTLLVRVLSWSSPTMRKCQH